MLAYISNIYTRLVLERPRFVLLAITLLLIFFASFIRYFKLDASADSLLLENDKDLKIFREINEHYQTRDFLLIAFTPEQDLFAQSVLDVIGSMRDELMQLENVDSVVSIIDVPLLTMTKGKLSDAVKNIRVLEDPSVDRVSAKKELTTSPLFKNMIISEDAKTTALVIYIKTDDKYLALQKQRDRLRVKETFEGLTEEEKILLNSVRHQYEKVKIEYDIRNHENIRQVRNIIDQYRQYGEIKLGGVPMIADDMITFVKNDLIIFGFGVFVFLIGMLSIIFRRPRWVLLPLLSCTFSGLIMMGLLGLVGWDVTVISSNFISLMLILTMSMNVHLVVRFRELNRDYPEAQQKDLVLEMTRRMVWPCLYTALTTMIGFSSLFVSDIKPVIDFGWMMTIGLMVAFVITFLLFPAILVGLNRLEPISNQMKPPLLTTILARFTERYGSQVLFISLILAAISLYGMTQLKVENSFIDYFSENTEIYQGQKLIDEKLGGTAPLDIIIDFKEQSSDNLNPENDLQTVEDEWELDDLFGEVEVSKSDTWFTDYKIERIKTTHRYLESLPEVGKVLSLASFLELAENLNQGQAFDVFEMALIYKQLSEELRASLIDPYISIEEDQARITVRILDSLKELRRKELLERIHEQLPEKLDMSEDKIRVTGLLVLYNNMLQSLFRSQILTLGAVMLGIATMLLILFRSLPLAIIGTIPNILAAIIILGLMGLMDIPLDMMTITIAAITIGIAVDDCIHYIYRFREEYSRRGDYLATMHYCHANIGRAMFYTSVTIIIGFSILVMSNFIPTIYFGLLTTLAMFIALLAALTLLPRLILLWKPF